MSDRSRTKRVGSVFGLERLGRGGVEIVVGVDLKGDPFREGVQSKTPHETYQSQTQDCQLNASGSWRYA